MSKFSTLPLVNNQVLVIDSVENKMTKLDAGEWNSIKIWEKKVDATEAFDAEIAEYFKPFNEILDNAVRKFEGLEPKADPNSVYEVTEGVDAVEGIKPKAYSLSKDSQILRLIESGQDDRLIWIGEELEILAAS